MERPKKELIEIGLTRAEALRAKHEFFRAFTPLEEVADSQRDLYYAVCGAKFTEFFPEVAAAVKFVKETEQPLLIEGLAMGYTPPFDSADYSLDFISSYTDNYHQRTGKKHNNPYTTLFAALTNLLGFKQLVGKQEPFFHIHYSEHEGLGRHTHESWAIVKGIRGRDCVTRLFDAGVEIGAPVMNRPKALLLPPRMPHSVDKFRKETFPTPSEKTAPRQTAGIFPDVKDDSKFTPEQLTEANALFYKPPGKIR